MKRRLFATVLAIIMVISVLPVTAMAVDLEDPLPEDVAGTQIDNEDLSETEEDKTRESLI